MRQSQYEQEKEWKKMKLKNDNASLYDWTGHKWLMLRSKMKMPLKTIKINVYWRLQRPPKIWIIKPLKIYLKKSKNAMSETLMALENNTA